LLATGEGCIATRSIRLRRGQQNIVAAPFVCLAMAATLADVIGYRFLVDRDVSKVAEHLPRKRTLTLSDAGLPEGADDSLIVQEAYERRCIIVSANGEHFVSAMRRFMRVQKKKQCYDLNGLIVLPSGS